MGDRDGFRDRSPVNQKKYSLIIENIPTGYRWQDLKDLFRKEIGGVAYVAMLDDKNGDARAIVEVDDYELYEKAMEKLHRYPLKKKKLIVVDGSDYSRRSPPPRNRDRHGPPRDDGNWEGGRDRLPKEPIVWGDTYGLSPNFLESLGIAPPLVHRVFVANLDYKVNQKKLREVFRLAGKVRECDLSVDNDGKSRGFAVIEYDHPVESVQAISMFHNQSLYDRKMTVRMDRVDPAENPLSRLPEGLQCVGMGLGADGAPLRDVAKNLPKLANLHSNTLQNSLQNAAQLGNLSAFGGSVSQLGAFSSSVAAAAALQQAALNTGGSSLLGAGNLDLLGRSDITARELALRDLAAQAGLRGLGQSSLGSSSPGLRGSGVGNGGNVGFNSGVNPNLLDIKSDRKALENFFRDRGSSQRGSSDSFDTSRQKGSDTVIVDNLPQNYTWQLLKDKFRDAGEVKYAEVRGNVGMIRFASEWEAMFAVSLMNGSRIDGRTIEVRVM